MKQPIMMMMSYLQRVAAGFICISLLQLTGVQGKEIIGGASDGNFLLYEQYKIMSGLPWNWNGNVTINSNVPLTVQRYLDERNSPSSFLNGREPVSYNDVAVLVTSNCSDTEDFTPQVNWGEGSIEINVLGVPKDGGEDMAFLDAPSFYHIVWSYGSYACYSGQNTPPPSTGPTPSSSACVIRPLQPFSLLASLVQTVRAKDAKKDLLGQNRRNLQSSNNCIVNTEVLIDGCSHQVVATAPSVRFIDSTLENFVSATDEDDECKSNYEADLVFTGDPYVEAGPATEGEQSESGNDISLTVQKEKYCERSGMWVDGRPFVDNSGSTLLAVPVAMEGDAGGWAATTTDAANVAPASTANSTAIEHNQLLLGEDWARSALGEHASIASFAAFSIALQTNGAPGDLVEGALNAALDEVRHAKTSFAIASRLVGRDIGPGPLPESQLSFSTDLTALGLAVAKEGCVDETLSALEAAAKVDMIGDMLINGSKGNTESKYSGIDTEVLIWVRDELRTIALEEGGHSALAWRTIDWVCSVDSEACDTVKQKVLNEVELERAFQRRFEPSDTKYETFDILMTSWKKIYASWGGMDTKDCVVGENDIFVGGNSFIAEASGLMLRSTAKVGI